MGSMVRHSLVFSLYDASFSQFFTRLDTMSGNDPASQVLLFSAQPRPHAEPCGQPKRTACGSIGYFQARRAGPVAGQALQRCQETKRGTRHCLHLGQQERNANRMPSRACTPREKLRLALV